MKRLFNWIKNDPLRCGIFASIIAASILYIISFALKLFLKIPILNTLNYIYNLLKLKVPVWLLLISIVGILWIIERKLIFKSESSLPKDKTSTKNNYDQYRKDKIGDFVWEWIYKYSRVYGCNVPIYIKACCPSCLSELKYAHRKVNGREVYYCSNKKCKRYKINNSISSNDVDEATIEIRRRIRTREWKKSNYL